MASERIELAVPERRGSWAVLRRQLFAIDPDEAEFRRRGFEPAMPARQERLESIGRTFVRGYNHAIVAADPSLRGFDLEAVPVELRGFVFEGAAMAFALLDILSPFKHRYFQRFITGAANSHVYMAYVGAGWALARISMHLAWRLGPLDPRLRWLAMDGYGFHEAYFNARKTIDRRQVPWGLRHYAVNAFDQGVGRALWFAKGADVAKVAATIATFPEDRRGDLWSGVGLAATYACGVDQQDLEQLQDAARFYRAHVGQGAAFASKARQRAGNAAVHTEMACRTLCNCSAHEAAAIADRALSECLARSRSATYESWRSRVRSLISHSLQERA